MNCLIALKLDSDVVQLYVKLYLMKTKDDFMLDYSIYKYSDT